MNRFSRYWLLVPLILVALVARDWAERPETFETDETVDMQALEADYYLEDFTTRRFDEDGVLEYIVSGATLSHYPDDGRSEVETPRLELRRDDATWNMSGARGLFVNDPDIFKMLGDVEVVRTLSALNQAADRAVDDTRLVINTADLELELDNNAISTERPFEIRSDAWQLSGVGLRSSIDEGKLVLLSNVNGTYDAAVTE